MHFVCRRCGGVFDIPADLSGMVTEAAKCCGHQVQEADVTAFGVCKDCRSAGTQPDSPAGMKKENQTRIKGGNNNETVGLHGLRLCV